jgi:hypothetical protein
MPTSERVNQGEPAWAAVESASEEPTAKINYFMG